MYRQRCSLYLSSDNVNRFMTFSLSSAYCEAPSRANDAGWNRRKGTILTLELKEGNNIHERFGDLFFCQLEDTVVGERWLLRALPDHCALPVGGRCVAVPLASEPTLSA